MYPHGFADRLRGLVQNPASSSSLPEKRVCEDCQVDWTANAPCWLCGRPGVRFADIDRERRSVMSSPATYRVATAEEE